MPGKVRTAVIGLGSIGPTHASWCASVPESELKAVCDVNAERAGQIAGLYGVDAYTDYRQVLERRDVDAVVIASPTYLHAPMLIEAAASGKHVAVEKPMCRTLDEADAMREAVKAAGVHSQYFENLCFAPAYRQAKEIVDAGGIGDILFVRCCESAGGGVSAQREAHEALVQGTESGGEGRTLGSWYLDFQRSGGGALISTGCHCVMYVRYLLDRQPVMRVYAETLNVVSPDSRVEDAIYLTLHHRDGQVAWVDASLIHALGTFDDRAEIHGSKGTIFLDLYRSSAIQVYSQQGYGRIGASMFGAIADADRNWSYPMPDERWTLGYAAELRHFLSSILRDRAPEITLDDGKATLEVVRAAYESSASGQAVQLPQDGGLQQGG